MRRRPRRAGHRGPKGTPDFPGVPERGLRPGGWRGSRTGRRRWPRFESTSQARAGKSGDASSAREISADSAAVRRPDQASAQAASWRAVMPQLRVSRDRQGAAARSWTQSAWPVGTAAEAAATSLRAWSARPGLSSAARSIASAAAAAPPRRCAWSAVASSSEATCSSGYSAPAARCQASRSGWSCRPSASWRCAAARCAKGAEW